MIIYYTTKTAERTNNKNDSLQDFLTKAYFAVSQIYLYRLFKSN